MCTLLAAWTEGDPIPDCEQIKCENCPYWYDASKEERI